MDWYPGKIVHRLLEKSDKGTELSDEELLRLRAAENAEYWLEKNYCGKKVKLNPVSIIKESERLMIPFPEDVVIEALHKVADKCHLQIDWERYDHYKRIMHPVRSKAPEALMDADPRVRSRRYLISKKQNANIVSMETGMKMSSSLQYQFQ